jgi:hypothetical protein
MSYGNTSYENMIYGNISYGNISYGNNAHSLRFICIWFYFDNLFWNKDTNKEALLSEHILSSCSLPTNLSKERICQCC